MADFNIAHELTAQNEGGYVNDKYDRGGETYRGVARNLFPNWEGWKIVDEYKKTNLLTRGTYIRDDKLDRLVDEFYKKTFWDSNRLSKIDNQEIANEVFDTGVNMGTKVAARMLQQALNLLNRDTKDYEDIVMDGIIGPRTLYLTNKHDFPKAILRTLNGLQFSRYVRICEKDPSQENNFRGWLRRV